MSQKRRVFTLLGALFAGGFLAGCDGMGKPNPPSDYKPAMPPGGGYGSDSRSSGTGTPAPAAPGNAGGAGAPAPGGAPSTGQ